MLPDHPAEDEESRVDALAGDGEGEERSGCQLQKTCSPPEISTMTATLIRANHRGTRKSPA